MPIVLSTPPILLPSLHPLDCYKHFTQFLANTFYFQTNAFCFQTNAFVNLDKYALCVKYSSPPILPSLHPLDCYIHFAKCSPNLILPLRLLLLPNTLCQIQIQYKYKYKNYANTKTIQTQVLLQIHFVKYKYKNYTNTIKIQIQKKNLTNTNAYPHNFPPPFNAPHINFLVDIHPKHKLWLAFDKSISTVSFIN